MKSSCGVMKTCLISTNGLFKRIYQLLAIDINKQKQICLSNKQYTSGNICKNKLAFWLHVHDKVSYWTTAPLPMPTHNLSTLPSWPIPSTPHPTPSNLIPYILKTIPSLWEHKGQLVYSSGRPIWLAKIPLHYWNSVCYLTKFYVTLCYWNSTIMLPEFCYVTLKQFHYLSEVCYVTLQKLYQVIRILLCYITFIFHFWNSVMLPEVHYVTQVTLFYITLPYFCYIIGTLLCY